MIERVNFMKKLTITEISKSQRCGILKMDILNFLCDNFYVFNKGDYEIFQKLILETPNNQSTRKIHFDHFKINNKNTDKFLNKTHK